jgi:beta-lactamase superfamily II metal-dependent hydrolase
MTRFATFIAFALSTYAAPTAAQSGDAVVRVVDIGAGLCAVISVPGGHGMLFDAGPAGATNCQDAVRELVPGRRLDLVVLSHSDADHIGMVRTILGPQPRPNEARRENTAAIIIHPGDPRGPSVTRMRLTLTEQAGLGACVYDLRQNNQPPSPCPTPPAGRSAVIAPGDSFMIGAGRATFIAGWGDGNRAISPGDARIPDDAARNNGLSLVVRFDYGGHSVLLTGDSLGRRQGDPADTCAYAERIMVERAATVPIDSDVLVAGHHGADNASSTCFIRAVTPTYVVFAAGHEYRHPRQAAVTRFTDNGVRLADLFRTDLGDNEGGTEMTEGSGRCADPTGDDDVEIRLPLAPSGRVSVGYRGASRTCP